MSEVELVHVTALKPGDLTTFTGPVQARVTSAARRVPGPGGGYEFDYVDALGRDGTMHWSAFAPVPLDPPAPAPTGYHAPPNTGDTVHVLVQYRAGSGMNALERYVHHVELFSTRPRTPWVGGDPDSWPDEYEVYVGSVDGGDSVLLETQDGLTPVGKEHARLARDMEVLGAAENLAALSVDVEP